MRRPPPLASLLFGLLILTGCVSSQELTTPSETLEDVNRKLEGRKATLSFVGGEVEKEATSVEVSPEFVSYRTRGNRDKRRPTSELSQITITAGNGGLIGLAVGILPGILVVKWPYECSESCIGVALTIGYGAVAAVVGGVLGAVIGASTDKTYVIYAGPVERYRDP